MKPCIMAFSQAPPKNPGNAAKFYVKTYGNPFQNAQSLYRWG